MMKNNILFLCLMLALSACTSQSDNHSAGVKEGELFSLDITTLDDEIHTVYFSDLMESVEIIQLDTASEAYMPINQLMVSNNYLLTTNGKHAKLFRRSDGKFISNIGNRGQGPGEYFIVDGGIIDERNKRVYISDMVLDHIVAYDWKGKHLPDEAIQLPLVPSWKEVYLNENKDSALVFVSPKSNGVLVRFRNSIETEAEPYLCWQQDLKGNVSKSISPGHLVMPNEINTHNRIYVSHVTKDSPIYTFCIKQAKVYLKDTLYHYNKATNHFYPAYTTNFPHNECNLVFSTESPLHYYTTYQRYKEGKLIAPQNMETNRLVQVEKKTGKARYIRLVNDYLGGLEVSGVNFRYSMKDNYVFFRFNDALKLKEQLEEVLNENTSMDNSVRERITHLKNSLNEDSNDVIVLCTFKKE